MPTLTATAPADDAMMTVLDVALLMKLRPTTIREWIKTGKILKPRKLNHEYRWLRSEMMEYIAGLPVNGEVRA